MNIDYRKQEAEKLIQSIKKFNTLDNYFLHSFGIDVKKWKAKFYDYLEYNKINDIRATALHVVQDIDSEYQKVIGRALEAFRLLLEIIEEQDQDFKRVKEVADTKVDILKHAEKLENVIKSLEEKKPKEEEESVPPPTPKGRFG